MKLRIVLLAGPTVLFATSALAAPPVVDQSAPVDNPIPFTFAIGGPYQQVLYQSFTVGLEGRLAELHVPIGCASGELIVEVYDAGPDGLPPAGSAPRLHRTFDALSFPATVTTDFQPLPLGGRVGVTPGERLVIALSNPTGSCGIAVGIVGDPNLGGTGWADANDGPPVPVGLGNGRDDLPFETRVRLTGPSP